MNEPLIDLLADVWADIERVGAGLSEEQWSLPTDCPGWSVKDHVAHMIGTEAMLLGDKAPDIEVPDALHVRNDIGKFNEQWVAAYRSRSGKETLDDFRAITARRLDALRALTPQEWEKEGFTPEGNGPYRQFMAIRVFDCWYHDQDVREAIGREGYLEGPVADLALARIPTKGLPYVVGKKAGAPQGATVVFAIAGTPPITATIAVDGRAALVESAPTDPTSTLTLDRRTFARLAGGRWSGEQARAKGSVHIGGDIELGNRIVEHMAFTI